MKEIFKNNYDQVPKGYFKELYNSVTGFNFYKHYDEEKK